MLDKVVITRFITCLLFVRTFVVHFCRAPRCTSVAGDRPMREIVFWTIAWRKRRARAAVDVHVVGIGYSLGGVDVDGGARVL